MKRVYLAGPDVFYDKPMEISAGLKKACLKVKLEGVFPLDADCPFEAGDTPEEKAKKIFDGNIALIRSCQGVAANMTPFRGPSTDVGTAWEMGFAYALGLPVVGYVSEKTKYEDRVVFDEYLIERFGLIDNLMLAVSIDICANLEDALLHLSKLVNPGRH